MWLLVGLALLWSLMPVRAWGISTSAAAAVLMDADTGQVLHHAAPGVRAGFIHVPCIPEQTEGTDRPSLPLAQLVTALEAAVSACCKG